MDTDILDKALDNCDLGDGYMAKVRQFPHKDMISQLTNVREVSPLLDEAYLEMERAVEFYYNRDQYEEEKEEKMFRDALAKLKAARG